MTLRLRYNDRTLDLGDAPFTIGRNATCQLRVESDSLLSRRHATFTLTDTGMLVTDHESRNGVMVNGQRIKKPTPLALGDTVLVGLQKFTVVEDQAVSLKTSSLVDLGHAHPHPSPEHARVDYVTIAGESYAVVPRADYLALCQKVATLLPRKPRKKKKDDKAAKAPKGSEGAKR